MPGRREGGSEFSDAECHSQGVGTTSKASGTICSLLSLEYPAEETGGSSVTSGDGSHRPRQELAYGPVNFGGRG